MVVPQAAQASVFVSVGIAPPAIPVYTQPLCPGDGYIWTPGYWAYGDAGYYWVDGAWVLAPYSGGLWTPGYWGYGPAGYFWNAGYWGRSIGYYGGINYGFGYFGTGFYGGYWNGGHFFYNRAYGNFGGGFRGNFYNRPVAGFRGGTTFRGSTTSFSRGSNYIAGNRGSNIAGRAQTSRAGFGGNAAARGNANVSRGAAPQARPGGGSPAVSRGGGNPGASRGGGAPAVSHGGGGGAPRGGGGGGGGASRGGGGSRGHR